VVFCSILGWSGGFGATKDAEPLRSIDGIEAPSKSWRAECGDVTSFHQVRTSISTRALNPKRNTKRKKRAAGKPAQVRAKEGTKCRGAIKENHNPQAMWVFSFDIP
jgi:hypothetical protein